MTRRKLTQEERTARAAHLAPVLERFLRGETLQALVVETDYPAWYTLRAALVDAAGGPAAYQALLGRRPRTQHTLTAEDTAKARERLMQGDDLAPILTPEEAAGALGSTLVINLETVAVLRIADGRVFRVATGREVADAVYHSKHGLRLRLRALPPSPEVDDAFAKTLAARSLRA